MSFSSATCLRRATSRAKSDVANKLVSMFLHGLSRKISASMGVAVTDEGYTLAVEAAFGNRCCYCGRPLELDRSAIEHLEGMNRFRLGLHIPGNVMVSCRRCNIEKRRDDQKVHLVLANTGWESFLCHDSRRCNPSCRTCLYWQSIWPDPNVRVLNLSTARQAIHEFRANYPESLKWSSKATSSLRNVVDVLYRECQRFAEDQIRQNIESSFAGLGD